MRRACPLEKALAGVTSRMAFNPNLGGDQSQNVGLFPPALPFSLYEFDGRVMGHVQMD